MTQAKKSHRRSVVVKAALSVLLTSFSSLGADMSNGADNFYKSDQVTVQNVTFNNQYGMAVAGHLFMPKNLAPGAKSAARTHYSANDAQYGPALQGSGRYSLQHANAAR